MNRVQLKEGFILRKLLGNNMVMPTSANLRDFRGALLLNDTAAFIFEQFQRGSSVDDAVQALMAEYEVTAEKAREGVLQTIDSLTEAGVLK